MLPAYVLSLVDALAAVGRSIAEHPDEFLAEVIHRTAITLASSVVVAALVAGASRLRQSWRGRRGE